MRSFFLALKYSFLSLTPRVVMESLFHFTANCFALGLVLSFFSSDFSLGVVCLLNLPLNKSSRKSRFTERDTL